MRGIHQKLYLLVTLLVIDGTRLSLALQCVGSSNLHEHYAPSCRTNSLQADATIAQSCLGPARAASAASCIAATSCSEVNIRLSPGVFGNTDNMVWSLSTCFTVNVQQVTFCAGSLPATTTTTTMASATTPATTVSAQTTGTTNAASNGTENTTAETNTAGTAAAATIMVATTAGALGAAATGPTFVSTTDAPTTTSQPVSNTTVTAASTTTASTGTTTTVSSTTGFTGPTITASAGTTTTVSNTTGFTGPTITASAGTTTTVSNTTGTAALTNTAPTGTTANVVTTTGAAALTNTAPTGTTTNVVTTTGAAASMPITSTGASATGPTVSLTTAAPTTGLTTLPTFDGCASGTVVFSSCSDTPKSAVVNITQADGTSYNATAIYDVVGCCDTNGCRPDDSSGSVTNLCHYNDGDGVTGTVNCTGGCWSYLHIDSGNEKLYKGCLANLPLITRESGSAPTSCSPIYQSGACSEVLSPSIAECIRCCDSKECNNFGTKTDILAKPNNTAHQLIIPVSTLLSAFTCIFAFRY